MFGKTVERYCPTCKKTVEDIITVAFNVDSKEYYNLLHCPQCKSDLAEEDRKAIKQAKEDKKEIGVIMY